MEKKDTIRKKSAKEALTQFLSIVDDPLEMDHDEINAMLTTAGFDVAAFYSKLAKDIEQAKKKAKLISAKASRQEFLSGMASKFSSIPATVEEKRAEIQRRLGLLGSQPAAVYNRLYDAAEGEDDLDDLLETLRSLDERAGEEE